MPAKKVEARATMLEMPFPELNKELGLAPNEFRALSKAGAYGKASFTVIGARGRGSRKVRLSPKSLSTIRRFHKTYTAITHAARETNTSDHKIKSAVKLFATLGKHPLADEFLKLTRGKIEFKTYGNRHFLKTKRIPDLQRLLSALPIYQTQDQIKSIVETLRPPNLKALPEGYQVFQKARNKLASKERGLQKAIIILLEHAGKQHGLKGTYTLEQLAAKSVQQLSERHLEAAVKETPSMAIRMFNEAPEPEKRRIKSYISALVALELPQRLEHNLFQRLAQKQPEERPNAISRVLERLDHQAYHKNFDQKQLLDAMDASATETSPAVHLLQQKYFPLHTGITPQLEELPEHTLDALLEGNFEALPTNLFSTRRLQAMLKQLEAEKAKKGAGASLADRRDRSRRRKTGEKKR